MGLEVAVLVVVWIQFVVGVVDTVAGTEVAQVSGVGRIESSRVVCLVRVRVVRVVSVGRIVRVAQRKRKSSMKSNSINRRVQ